MSMRYLVGTYTKMGASLGIYQLDAKTIPEIKAVTPKNSISNPTYLIHTKDKTILYTIVASEAQNGGIASYAINADGIDPIAQFVSELSSPCHLVLDKTERYIITSHYHLGKTVSYKVKKGQIIGDYQTIDHTNYQQKGQKSRVHFAQFTADNKFVLVCDLGLDSLFVYPFDTETGLMDVTGVQRVKTTRGSGPRHLVINKTGENVYVLDELSGDIDYFNFNQGKLSFREKYNPYKHKPTITLDGAAIKIHPRGKYLYTSQRAVEELNIFEIQATGELVFLSSVKTQGVHPRDFTISADGLELLVVNQVSNNVIAFTITETGELLTPKKLGEIPNPVCILAI
ncbi:MAG: lactonase family protein [Culicoidibacterales bacterium]